jgi:Domain of unknown function (DUF222)
MSDVIRLASHAHHYLAIFDKGKALALYHTKRLASPAQRIVLHASAAMTLDVYADLFDSDLATVAENVAKMWPRQADN